jgi:hypothetical protein
LIGIEKIAGAPLNIVRGHYAGLDWGGSHHDWGALKKFLV